MSAGVGIQGAFAKKQTRQSIELDPQTKALNQFRLNTLTGLNYGGLSDAFRGLDYTRFPDRSTNDLLQFGTEVAQQPGLNAQDWYNQTLQGLDFSQQQQNIQDIYGQVFGAGNQYYNQILGPQIGNDYALMGLGRSGGRQEAEAKGLASVALPIQQQLAGTLSGLNTNYLQNLFSLNQAYPGVDTGLRNAQLQRLQQGVGFSDYNRQVQQENQEKALQAWLSLIGETPYTPSPTTRGREIGYNFGGQASASTGGTGGGGAFGSDIKVKTDIAAFDPKAFLETLAPFSYKYKRPDVYGTGTHYGVMAQDLEKSAIGASFVHERVSPTDGVVKYVNYEGMASLFLACIVDLHQRIKKLEV